jgi:predicted dehydrogenase
MNIGIIGYRNHAQRLGKIIEQDERCRNILYYHPDAGRLDDWFGSKEVADGVSWGADFDDLLSQDALFIVTPTHTHWDYLQRLLEASYPGYIFCEKPPCATVESLHAIQKLDSSNKSRIFFNFNYRYSRFATVCREAMASGAFGDPIALRFSSAHGLAFKPHFADNWRNCTDKILENIIGNVGSHYIDLAYYLMGRGSEISLHHLKKSPLTKHADSALILVETALGLPATVLISYAAPFSNTAEMLFSDAIVNLRNGVLSVRKPRDFVDESGLFAPAPEQVIAQFATSREYFDNALQASVGEFFRYVVEKRPIPPEALTCSLDSTEMLLQLQGKAWP